MPLEAVIVAPKAAGMEGLRQVAALMNPPLRVEVGFGGAWVVARDPDAHLVAALQRPQQAACAEDIPRCADEPVPEASVGGVWTEAVVPFTQAQPGLTWVAAVAVASGGRMLVKGAGA